LRKAPKSWKRERIDGLRARINLLRCPFYKSKGKTSPPRKWPLFRVLRSKPEKNGIGAVGKKGG